MYISFPEVGDNKDYSMLEETIKVRLSGNITIKTAEIQRQDCINKLSDIINQKDSRFVYNGMILNPFFSFSFYGINDTDTIFVLPPSTKPTPISTEKREIPDITQQLREHFDKHWANKIADPEEAFQRFRDTADPRTSKEYARIMDIQRAKIESNPSQYRKLCAKFNQTENEPTHHTRVTPIRNNNPFNIQNRNVCRSFIPKV